MRVLMVCSGNICRSPTAEAVLRAQVHAAGLDDVVTVDGAGTGGWHAGDPPDPRATAAAARRGIALTGRARQVSASDFETFDIVAAVDAENLARLRRVAPPGCTAQLRLLGAADVPDPYYGGDDGFERVLDQVETACARLLEEIRGDLREG